MKAVHSEDGIKDKISELLKEPKPDWDAVVKSSTEWVSLATDMTKDTPKKGSKESWDKLAGKWLTDAKALESAAEKKELAAANKALKSLGSSCKGCHGPHKGK
jgi:cytochrome c556